MSCSLLPSEIVLTERERQVLKLLRSGASNKQISHELDITVRTVEFHLGNIYQKMDVACRTQAVLVALQIEL